MKYIDFRNKIKIPLFSRRDIKLLGLKVFDYQLSSWQKAGHITKIKNGLYAFSDSTEKIQPEEIADLIYAPSYISLEKALSFHGIIPEMVPTITCVSPKATRKFKNSLGYFTYRHVKPSLFFGYRQQPGGNKSFLLAEPEKALLDLLYLNNIGSEAGLVELRINWRGLNKGKLNKYAVVFGKANLIKLLNKHAQL
jgi:hypothetical protein